MQVNHGSAAAAQAQQVLTSSIFLTTASTMSLPRSNYDPRRVCINPFPAITLGKHRRTIGIYLAGGLVRLFCLDVPYVI